MAFTRARAIKELSEKLGTNPWKPDGLQILQENRADFEVAANVILGVHLDKQKVTASADRLSKAVCQHFGWNLPFNDHATLGAYLVGCLIRAGYYRTRLQQGIGRTLNVRKKKLLDFSEHDPYTSLEPFPPWTSGTDNSGRKLVTASYPQLDETIWEPESRYFREYRDGGWPANFVTAANTIERNAYTINEELLELVNKVAEDETKAPPKSVPEIEGYWERLQVRRKRVHTRRGIWTDFAKPDERTFDHLAELKQRDKAESRRRGPPYLRLNDPRRLITVSQIKRINAFQAEEIPVGQHRDAIAQAHSRFHRVVKRSNELVGKRFYQRVHVDYRGRVYLNRNIVNWQGDDLARSLVQFAEGKTIPTAAMKYLWIQAGNLWGAKGDAKALERAGKALKPKILQFAKNAFGTYKKWSHLGDDKWKFIRTCFEIRDRMGNPTFKSHLICELDQSMSGPQHMSLIMGDPESLRKCNGGVRFRDGYSEIAENVASLGKTDRSLKRRLVKTAFVPLIYGGDAFTAFLKYSDLSHDIAFLRELGPPGMMALAREVVEEIQAYIPAYQNYRTAIERWAREQWNADLEKGYIPRLHWTTPSGFPVYHYCNEPGRFETRYHIESDSERTRGVRAKLAKMIWRPPLQTVNDRSRDKIVKAIAPNYIHSLDASIIHQTVSLLGHQRIPVIPLHDALGAHACNMEKVGKMFRVVLTDSYLRLDPPFLNVERFRYAMEHDLLKATRDAEKSPHLAY
jgi:hypothetical protein